jgi:hypothetical protein
MSGGIMYFETSASEHIAHMIVFFQDLIPYWFWVLKHLYWIVIETLCREIMNKWMLC